jgi:hypothetical protein
VGEGGGEKRPAGDLSEGTGGKIGGRGVAFGVGNQRRGGRPGQVQVRSGLDRRGGPGRARARARARTDEGTMRCDALRCDAVWRCRMRRAGATPRAVVARIAGPGSVCRLAQWTPIRW